MATGTYEHATLQNLVDQLAQDVSDTGKTFFTSTELQRAVIEALQLSNVLTARGRHTLHFTTTAGVAWYDLSTLAPTALGSTATDRTAIENMQYRLMEPVDASAGATMTERYSFAELLRSLQQSRDRFLVDSEHSVTRRAAQSNVEADGRVELDEAIAKVLRVVWTDALNHKTVLRNSTDEGSAAAVRLDRRINFGTPRRWSIIARPQLQLQLDPIPDEHLPSLSLQLTTVETGDDLSTTANGNTGTVMDLPDDLAAGAAWSALELVLSKHGMGQDRNRAELAGRLGTLMRGLAASLPSVLQVAVNGVDVRLGTVQYLDAKEPAWEGAARGIPRRAAVMGDWLALHPVPDDVHSIEVTLVSKFPALALTDYVQLGREHLSGILAWAKQILLFKVGGAPLARAAATAGLLIEQARAYNEIRVASCAYLSEFLSAGMQTMPAVAREAPPVDLSGDPRDDASSRNERSRDPNYSPYYRQIGGR